MNLKNFMLLYTLSTLFISCSVQPLAVTDNVLSDKSETCTILGDTMLCTDSKIRKAPKGCTLVRGLISTYKCPVSRFLGYQCISPSTFSEAANAIDDLTLKNKLIIRSISN